MKKTLVALAALSAIAGAAQAQSSVTMYGLLDLTYGEYHYNAITASGAPTLGNAAYTSPPATVTAGNTATYSKSLYPITKLAAQDGGFNGSRLGFKGSEDLGGGLSTIFNLEAGINLYNGTSTQGGTLFGRRAIVGLSGTSWGTVGIGRNSSPFDDVSCDHGMMQCSIYDPSITNNAPQVLTAVPSSGTSGKFQPQTADNIAAVLLSRGPGGNGNTAWLGYSTRFDNSVKWQSPVWSGFSASVMYAFGQDNTDNGVQQKDASNSSSLNAKYTNGPLLVSVGYQSESMGGTEATLLSGLTSASGSYGLTSPSTSSIGSVGSNQNTITSAATVLHPALTNTLLSAAYDFGVAKVGVGINQAKLQDVYMVPIAGGAAAPIAAQNEYNLSVAVPFGATVLSAGYAVSQGDTLGKASGYGIQAKYILSKRTFVYGGYTNLTPYDNLANYAVSQGAKVDNVYSYGLGIQHNF